MQIRRIGRISRSSDRKCTIRAFNWRRYETQTKEKVCAQKLQYKNDERRPSWGIEVSVRDAHEKLDPDLLRFEESSFRKQGGGR